MTAGTARTERAIELRWRPAPLAVVMAATAAAAMAIAVLGSRAELVAFAAPLLGVLCSVYWQPPPPRVHARAEPSSQRCFESETVGVRIWLTTDTGEPLPGPPTVTASAAMRLEVRAEKPTSITAVTERWGRYPLRIGVAMTARGGLLTGAGVVEAAEVTVFPRTVPHQTAVASADPPDRVGTHLTEYTGQGVEYADIRTYVPGDPLRAVNWPVSARRGRLHVTERLTDRAVDVVVVVDVHPQPSGPASRALERAMRGATQVVQTALRGGDRAGVVTLGARHPHWLGPDVGQRQFYRILDTVLGTGGVGAAAAAGVTATTLAPRVAVPPRAVVVAFSALLDAEFTLALTDLRQHGHEVLAVDVLPDCPFAGETDPLIARMWAYQRSGMYRDLAVTGIDVAPWAPGDPLDQALRLVTARHRNRPGVRR